MDLSHLLNSAPTGELQTRRTPCPEGDYPARIDDIEFRQVKTKNGDRTIMRVIWSIEDEGVKAALDRETLKVSQDIWLDLDSTGGIDSGKDKNIGLGQLRAVFDQNSPGIPIGALKGTGLALVHVNHRRPEGSDEAFVEINRVAKML